MKTFNPAQFKSFLHFAEKEAPIIFRDLECRFLNEQGREVGKAKGSSTKTVLKAMRQVEASTIKVKI